MVSSISLSVARSCFVACSGCYNFFGDNVAVIERSHIVAFVRFLLPLGLKKVTVCGGDPLSRQDIVELLIDLKQLGLFISLDTVGTAFLNSAHTIFFGKRSIPRIDPKTIVAVVDRIGIPLDGTSTTVISTFRKGRLNIFSEQMSIIHLLIDSGFAVCTNTVCHAKNIEDIPNLARLMNTISKIELWQVFEFMPSGPLASQNALQFSISSTAFQKLRSIYGNRLSSGVAVEWKSARSRHHKYLLVDSDGIAWTPNTSSSNKIDSSRIVLGNIRQSYQFNMIYKRYRRIAQPPEFAETNLVEHSIV